MRVLVCDDDAACRFTTKRLLTRLTGCTVAESEDGVQALELLANERFDLALIDLHLPRISGVEVVETIRQSPAMQRLRVVVLSQERTDEVVQQLAALGVDAYLLKPLREQMVVTRIAPLLARRARPNGKVGWQDRSALRLSKDSPALLVDGDSNFRHFFVSVASRYGPVIEAQSGANALALIRQSPVPVVFIGEGLGLLGPAALVRKIRENDRDDLCRIVSIGDGSARQGAGFDDTIARVFVPERLIKELRPLVRLLGPLTSLEELAPNFRMCLTSGVTQVFGMMSNLEVVPSASAIDRADRSVTSSVDIEINERYQLAVELRLPHALVREVSSRMFGCDVEAVTEETCLSTSCELANMVTGRLDCWLKERSLTSHCTLPDARLADAAPAATPAEETGFQTQFEVPEAAATFTLSACVRDRLTQYQ